MTIVNHSICAILDGNKTVADGVLSEGALCSLIAIAMVFSILLLIIGITTLIFKMLGLFDLKAEIDAARAKKTATPISQAPTDPVAPVVLDENDEEMMAAVLVATIDFREESKQDVRLVRITEVKQ